MRKHLLLLLALIVMALPNYVYADDYINQNGVVISDENYNNLLKLYSEKRISILTHSDYEEIMSKGIDFNNVEQSTKYIKTEFNQVTGEYEDTEVTEEEFNNYDPNSRSRATIIETAYKRINLSITPTSGSYAYYTFNALWKIMPATRSYDVIGVRLSNLSVVNGTQDGFQTYDLNGQTDYVSYSFNGTNTKHFSNGYGVSMNLLNSDITYLECDIEATLIIDAYPATIFASYQHAVENVTLAQSQDYTIGVGLGNVFVFNNYMEYRYDGMEGTYSVLRAS